MKRSAWAHVAAVIGALGCGCGDAPFQIFVQLPSPGPLEVDCAGSFTDLRAELHIGGYDEPCPLEIDASSRAASGTCPEIAVGIVRHTMVAWYQAPPTGSTSPVLDLSFYVSYVDLRRDTLEQTLDGGASHVTLDFPNDGVNGLALWHPRQLDDIPAEADAETPLEKALAWALERIRSGPRPMPLDGDGDGCANLVEACDGVLYDDDVFDPADPSTTCSITTPP